MAGERKGKVFEAITRFALMEIIRPQDLFGKNVFWNETPETMSIEPDLTVGASPSDVQSAFLVTHSGSPKDSSRKLWRNIGELVELKTCFRSTPKVFAITFGRIKESLAPLHDSAFDSHLHVVEQPYAEGLESLVTVVLKDKWNGKSELSDAVASAMRSNISYRNAVVAYAADISEFARAKAMPQNQIWTLHRKRSKPSGRRSRLTTIRRGYAKLLLLPSFEMAYALWIERKKLCSVPDYLYKLGLVAKTLGGYVAQDDEIKGLSECLPAERIRALMEAPIGAKTKGFVRTLRSDSQVASIAEYISTKQDRYADHKLLFADASELALNPFALIHKNESEDWPPEKVWLIDYLIEIVRTSTGLANGYGYAQLAAEVADPNGHAKGFDRETRLFLQSPWGHLSEWIDREKNEMPTLVLAAICCVLAARIALILKAKWKDFVSKSANNYLTNILETKLAHRGIDPLRVLLEAEVGRVDRARIRTCFAEHAMLGGQAGNVEAAVIRHTLVKWQSCTDKGRDHKKKELCGQAVGLRYSWAQNRFGRRNGIQKLILILDGTWRQDDLNALFRAGWDEIFYPDEMDKLATAIV